MSQTEAIMLLWVSVLTLPTGIAVARGTRRPWLWLLTNLTGWNPIAWYVLELALLRRIKGDRLILRC